MNYEEMSIEQLESRQAEIAGMETDGVSAEDLEKRADELESIKGRA